MQVHPEPQHAALLRNRVFAGVTKLSQGSYLVISVLRDGGLFFGKGGRDTLRECLVMKEAEIGGMDL